MEMRRLMLVVLSISLLLLSSCSGGSSTKTGVGNSVGTLDSSVYSGKEGLTLNIKKSGNDVSIFENSEMQMLFTLKNNGAYNVKKFIFPNPINDWRYIKNDISFGEDIGLKLGEELNTEDYSEYPFLQGKSILSKTTVDSRFTCTIHSSQLGKSEDQHTESLSFSYCYDYETRLQDNLCVDTDIYGTSNMKKSCTVSKKSYSNGQGAPVSVDSVDVSYSERDGKIFPNLRIKVSSYGTGKVLTEKGYSDLCLYSDSGEQDASAPLSGVVKIKSIEFSRFKDSDFTCYMKDLKLDANSEGILCQLSDSLGFDKKEGDFITGFTVVLSYYYQDSKSVDVVIKKSQ